MISIVIPLYNEGPNLDQLHGRLTGAGESWEEDYEILLVDDGSTDGSTASMRRIVDCDPRFRLLRLSRNFGHQAAISAGIRSARGDAVVIMDGDLQDPPEELATFLDKWREGYEVVYAVRTKRKEHLLKRIAYKAFYRMLRALSDIEIPLDSGDFCVMDRKVADALIYEMPERRRFVRGLRAYAGFRQIGVTYERDRRHAGQAKYTLRKLFRLALDGLFDFSTFPLRIATYLGFLIAVPAFLVGVFLVLRVSLGLPFLGAVTNELPSVPILATGLFLQGGVTLIVLGIVGEYLGRIYQEVKRRPAFIVAEEYPVQPSPARVPAAD